MNRVKFEKEFWEEKAKSKDVDREMHDPEIDINEEVKLLTSEIPRGGKIKALEIGCGVGRLVRAIDTSYRNIHITGIDISKTLIELAKRKTPAVRLTNKIDYEVCDGRSLPNKKYDFIYSVTVFQHLPFLGVSDYILEVRDKLYKDGIFRFQFIEGDEKEPMSNHFNLKAITELLDWAGLKIIKYDKGLIYPNWTWITVRKL